MALPAIAATTVGLVKPTLPLHARFTRLPAPSPSLIRSSHTLNVVTGKAYIFGGDVPDGSTADNAMHIVTLPTDEVLKDTDYQCVPAKASSSSLDEQHDASYSPSPRAAHASTSISSTIYIFGGRPPSTSSSSSSPLNESSTIHAFDTQTHTWHPLTPNNELCTSGLPCARTSPSLTSTIHPTTPSKPGEDGGTIFLHGGFSSSSSSSTHGTLLRDTWSFDISTRIWTLYPPLPTPSSPNNNLQTPGLISLTANRLYRVGDAHGRVDSLEIVRDGFNDGSGVGELGVGPKTGRWESRSFGVIPGLEGAQGRVDDVMGASSAFAERPDMGAGAGFVSVRTGQGRGYLVLVMGEKEDGEVAVGDSWAFQIASEKGTAGMVKDVVRGFVGAETGEERWAKVEVVEEGDEPLERLKGLSRFGCDAGGDWGVGSIVLWGGIGEDGCVKGDGWIMTVE